MQVRRTNETAAIEGGLTRYDALLLGMILVIGFNIPAVKWAIEQVDPYFFNAVRYSLATVASVAAFVMTRQTVALRPGDLGKLIGLGLLGYSMYQIGFMFAMERTLAGNMAIIVSMNPVFVALFSVAFRLEKITRRAWLGIAFAFCGSIIVILSTNRKVHLGTSLAGDITAVLITAAWALYVVLSRPLLEHYSAIKLNTYTMVIGLIPILVMAGLKTLVAPVPLQPIPSGVWWVIAGSAIFALMLSSIVWSIGTQKLGPTRTAAYYNLLPGLSALIAMRLLHESIGFTTWLGFGLVMVGLFFVRRGKGA